MPFGGRIENLHQKICGVLLNDDVIDVELIRSYLTQLDQPSRECYDPWHLLAM